MIRVFLNPQPSLEGAVRFSHKGTGSIDISQKVSGSEVDKFNFSRRVGEMRAIVEALNEVPCTGCVQVTVNDRCVLVDGNVGLWLPSVLPHVRQALAEAEAIAWDMHNRWPHCEVTISYTVTRLIKSKVA